MWKVLYGFVIMLWVWLLVVFVYVGDGEWVGENIFYLFSTWVKSLYIGVVVIVVIMFLMNCKFIDFVVFMLGAVLVGGFVLVPNDIVNIV